MSDQHPEERTRRPEESDALDTLRQSIKDLREEDLDDLAERLEAAAAQAAEWDD